MICKNLKHILAAVALALSVHQVALAAEETKTITVNGGFEKGLTGWRSSGDVAVEKIKGLDGHFSVRIGPGVGSITQRVAVGSDNHMMFSALINASSTGTANVALHRRSRSEVFDPIWATAYITRNHGYLVYDTLFGTDADGQVKPKWSIGRPCRWMA